MSISNNNSTMANNRDLVTISEAFSAITAALNDKTTEIMETYRRIEAEKGDFAAREYFGSAHYEPSDSASVVQFRALYAQFYASLGIKSRDDLEQLRKEHQNKNGVMNAFEQLRSVERQWDLFLDKIDQKINEGMANAQGATFADFDRIYLTDCENGKRLSLKGCLSNRVSGKYALLVLMRFYGCPHCCLHIQELSIHAAKFDRKLCNIVLVCKGSVQGGQSWVKKSGIQFPLLADDQAQFVSNFMFRRSAKSMLGTEAIDAALRSLAKSTATYGPTKTQAIAGGDGETDPSSGGEAIDPLTDLFQLGGDLIVDKWGKVIFFYHSGTLGDRPSVKDLLAKIPEA